MFIPTSPFFCSRSKKRHRPGSLDSVQLSAQSELRRQSLYLAKGLIAKEDLVTLQEESHAEVAAGYLLGPFESEGEVSAHLDTHDWSLSPRFVLRQGEEQKVRVIDDFKMSAVNKAFSSSSYLELQDTDYTVGLLRFVSGASRPRSCESAAAGWHDPRGRMVPRDGQQASPSRENVGP